MSDQNQEIYNRLNETEAEIERLETRVSVIVCTAMPVALAVYTILL